MLFTLSTFSVLANDLNKTAVVEDDLLLLSVKLNSFTISQNVDAYKSEGQLLIAVEPLFDLLQVKYQIFKNKITVWKNNEEFSFSLTDNKSELQNLNIWADDGYYIYLPSTALERLFDIKIVYTEHRLLMEIQTSSYDFPITVLEKLAKQRRLAQTNTRNNKKNQKEELPITIEDQYRLITFPHGQVSSQISLDNKKQNNNINVQLVSDLLYHSANININKSQSDKISGGLSLARYKTSSDDYILGAFDFYRLGDVSSINNSSLSKSASGVGVNFVRAPQAFRRENSKITIEQAAPPGWEAELFHNSQFVKVVTVPETGLLVFDDVEIFYGNNNFSIKVFGPFGEQKEFTQSYNLKSNPLSAGGMAYSLYGLDSDRTLFNNNAEEGGLELDFIGGTFDYGISDLWQIGVGFNQQKKAQANTTDDNNQIFSLKNNFNLPGILLENEFAINNNNGYQQKTTLNGQAFFQGSYNVSYSSGNGDFVARNNINLGKFQELSSIYNNYVGRFRFNFGARYSTNETRDITTFSNSLGYNFDFLRLTHNLEYSEYTTKVEEAEDFGTLDYRLNGRLSLSTSINRDFRLSANINYDPKAEDDVISKNSSLSAQWRLLDPWSLNHYLNLNYRPISESDKKWQLSHNMAWEAASHRLSLQTRYDQADEWSLSLNFSFFFGYDYHNNRTHFSNNINSYSASLNIHNYLDRQMNGRPDVLDYNLEGVTYSGNSAWGDRASGKDGRILLHGAHVNAPFKFQAHWKSGTQTINNDYVIYTHPGARVDVNMPFYLSSELAGFIYRGPNDIAVTGLTIDLLDDSGTVVDSQKTDLDGYYEFIDMKPNSYHIIVNQESLRAKALTGNIIGYQLLTPSRGGFAELPSIILQRLEGENDFAAEQVIPFVISEDIQERLIDEDDENQMQNLFSLPNKDKVVAEHELSKALVVIKKDSKSSMTAIDVKKRELSVQPTKAKPQHEMLYHDERQSEHAVKGYTLQLGAFSEPERAESLAQLHHGLFATVVKITGSNNQAIYKVYAGEFKNKNEALMFVRKNNLTADSYLLRQIIIKDRSDTIAPSIVSPTDVETNVVKVTPLKGWVIQWHAGQSKLNDQVINTFKSVGALYQAEKYTKKSDKVWHCLVSAAFTTKEQALRALRKSSMPGWVSELSNYQNVTLAQ
ncbi:MAG: SPOR domain-containing protein [Thalassotalea sp.]